MQESREVKEARGARGVNNEDMKKHFNKETPLHINKYG
jgi:hypothetical protein